MALNYPEYQRKFLSKDYFKTVTPKEKRDGFFLLTRTFSAGYPVEACKLMTLTTNACTATDFWHLLIKYKYGYRTPPFFRVFPNKSTSITKDPTQAKIDAFDTAFLSDYMHQTGLDTKQFDELRRFYPDELLRNMKSYDEYQKAQTSRQTVTAQKEEKKVKQDETVLF